MNVNSATALILELKRFEAPLLSNDDPRFSWLKYQFFKYFEDWLTIIEVEPGVYEKSEKLKMFVSSYIYKGHKNKCTYCHRTYI